MADLGVFDDPRLALANTPVSERTQAAYKQFVPRSEFNPYIQGARGAFCLALFIFHVANSGLLNFAFFSTGISHTFLLSLQYGVELFFGISGYVIFGVVRKSRDPWKFLLDRAIRILPVLWVTIPFVFTLEYLGHRFGINDIPLFELFPVLLANLLCLPPVVPLPLLHQAAWSLSFEFTFYIFAALSIWLRRYQGWVTLPLFLPFAYFLYLYPRAWFFIPGVLVASGAIAHPFLRRFTRHPAVFLALFLGAWWEVIGLNIGLPMSIWSPSSLVLFPIAMVAATIAFQGIVDGEGWIGRVLSTRAMRFLGLISYSFYMWEFITMAIVKRIIVTSGLASTLGVWSQAAFLLLALPVTIGVAWVSQRWIEQGLCGWLRDITRHKRSTVEALT